MASIINASTSGVGGVITTADSSGDLNIQSGGATKIAVTSTGAAITGTLSASGVITGNGSGLTSIPSPAALSTASGSAPSYSARAWVNFNGTGTVAIRASGNVSSITDNGTGNYTINFTTAMPDIDYATTVNTQGATTGSIVGEWGLYTQATNAFNTPTTSAFRITTWNSAVSGLADTAYVMATVFR